jgi:uncharacterized protein with ACT and thioredoxin-like domain
MSTISIDVDIDEIVYSLASYEKRSLLEELLNNMDDVEIIKVIKETTNFKESAGTAISLITGDDNAFESACNKISENRWRLNLADEEYILKLANKL